MDRLHAMTVFVAVAENLSFAAAGRALSIGAPAVTRTITALETHLGVGLFVRTTRQVRLTEAGERYLNDCRRILADVAESESTASGAHVTPRGLVSVTAPQLCGRRFVSAVVLKFLDAHPETRARLLFVDRPVNLVEEGIDIAVRLGALPDSGLKAVRVGSMRRPICAAPSYLDAHGAPETLEDLADHRLIASASDFDAREWRFGRDGSIRVPITPRLNTLTNDSAVDAAVWGWGLARLMSYQIAADVAADRLRVVLEAFEPEPIPVHVLHAHEGRAPATVRVLFDLLVEELRAAPGFAAE